MAEGPDAVPPPAAPRRPSAWRRTWLSPGGISAIAAVVTLLGGAVVFLAQQVTPAEPTTPPPASVIAGSGHTSLFVYGSSMPGMTRYDAISQYVTGSEPDSVTGLLYDSGLGYPLAKFGPGGEVPGFLLSLDPDTAESAMAEMTRVEAGLFHPVKVRTGSGTTAYAYEYIGATDDLPRIDVWDGSTAHYGQAVAWVELAEGDCFQPTEDEGAVLLAWCEAPHPWEVSFTGTLEATGTGPQQTPDEACDDAHLEYVGRRRPDSELAVQVFYAPADADGRERVLCAVGQAGALHRGSLRDAGR